MERIYNIVAIDDNPEDTKKLFCFINRFLNYKYGYQIKYEIYSTQDEFEQISSRPFDIVMFDFALTGATFNITNEAAKQGFELIKEFRRNNKRTKVIFYSGSFNLNDPETFNLTPLDFITIINELNVFSIQPRDIDHLAESIRSAIESLDTILISLEELVLMYGDDGKFEICGEKLSSSELLHELRNESQIGEAFRKKVNDTIISYFMKFGEL